MPADPDAYPCPCCGHLTFGQPPGGYEICDVCFWEDDPVQLRWPTWAGGANRPHLIEAQLNVARLGAMEARFARSVRAPWDDEPLDAGWRPIDLDVDDFESPGIQNEPWPRDLTTLYWWRPSFWRPPRASQRTEG